MAKRTSRPRLRRGIAVLVVISTCCALFLLANHWRFLQIVRGANFVVTNTNDSGAGSLRQAMVDANNSPGADNITFNIAGSGVQTISPTSPLPNINGQVTIDGTTQPGYLGTPIIELNGTSAGSTPGFNIFASGSVIRGLVINRFSSQGINLNSVSNCFIEGNYIGLNAAGNAASGNGGGIGIFGGPNNTVGGTTVAARNVISGNNNTGLLIGSGTSSNIVQGNFIGTDASGSVAVPNLNFGIVINDSPNNTIGGTTAGAGNVISGNTGVAAQGTGHGMMVTGAPASGNLIQGNYIGVDASGTFALPNVRSGIMLINGASGNTIGGNTAAARNVISGNSVRANNGNLDLAGLDIHPGSDSNTVSGNYIGTNAAGTAAVPNGSGVGIAGNNNRLDNNLISGNTTDGLDISNSSSGNLIRGNRIGTNAAGSGAIPNNGNGVGIFNSSNNVVGGTIAAEGSTIAFNTSVGVRFSNGTGNAALSNAIFSNGGIGIALNSANGNATAPSLSSASSVGGFVSVQGSLSSNPSTAFTIQFFANDACDPSGFGEGQIFLGSVATNTNAGGGATFSGTFPANLSANQVITATATDSFNNTSQFSGCRSIGTSGFNLTGRVLDNSGNPIAGLTVTLNGSTNTTTDSTGNYSFGSLPAGGNYTVAPSSTNYSFSPASQTFNNLSVDRIANFVGTQILVNISGKVTDANNNGLNNVTIALTKNGSAAGTTQTDGLGNYSFANQTAGADYVITPNGSFAPSSQTLSNLTFNAIANFRSTPSIPPQCATVAFGRTNFPVSVGPQSIAVGDFNQDGKSDLAVANASAANVSILLGTGTGSFDVAANFTVNPFPYAVTTADFNGDGHLDLATANQSTNVVSILLGNGTGSFGSSTTFPAGSSPRSIAAGDFNGDGKTDLVTANFNGNNVSILLGSGTGSFNAPTNFATDLSPIYVVVGDLNLDGRLDLAVAGDALSNASILLGSGTGTFSSPSNFPVGVNPESLTVGDFNGDNKPDLATANFNGDNVSVILGTGTGSFGAATNFAVGSHPESVVSGDFNGDGKIDLAVANEISGNVSILLGLGTGSFSAAPNLTVGTAPFAVVIGDFNIDGKLDLAVANANSANVSILMNSGSTCNTQAALSITGRLADVANRSLADTTLTLSGPITRVTQTDSNGNYSFANLVPGGNYSVTVQSNYFIFSPARSDFFNFSSSQIANFTAAPLAVPSPTPTPNDDFTSSARDASKWSIGAQTSSTVAFDPQVTTNQVAGQLIVAPLSQVSGLHYAGYVSANSFDLRNGSAKVELVKAATSGADTIFALGTDADNFYRFLVHTPGPPTALALRAKGRDGVERPLDTSESQLVFQVNVGGQITALSINYDPVQHRFMRFRHVPPTNSIAFETSPDNIDFTVQHTVLLQKSVSALTAELSAGTSNPTNPGVTVFDNFGLVTSTFQFSSASYSVGEADGSIIVTVTRNGNLNDAAAVDFATADGTARQKTKYTSAAGTLAFASGIGSRTFRVLLIDNQLAEGEQALNLLLSNAVGSGLNSPGRAVLTIGDNDTTLATTNPLEDARYFVTQHYYDFLSRVPDQSGLDFWTGQITQCGADVQCLRTQRITVSNAFFYEQEYQQTGSYVVRLYRAAYGNNQPISNNDNNPNFPNENKKLVNYSVFSTDRARVRGGPSLAQTQLDLAVAFVKRPEFTARYAESLAGPAYVDALIANINNDINVDLTSQRQALTDLYNQSGAQGRGAVLYRLADDNTTTNPINNRAFIDAEYNRSFVLTQYFGYLRRNPDIGGYLFWLGQVNSAPLRALDKQRAMVCSFITSAEYQQRFSLVTTHNNTECQ